jgi:hypothetical protein
MWEKDEKEKTLYLKVLGDGYLKIHNNDGMPIRTSKTNDKSEATLLIYKKEDKSLRFDGKRLLVFEGYDINMLNQIISEINPEHYLTFFVSKDMNVHSTKQPAAVSYLSVSRLDATYQFFRAYHVVAEFEDDVSLKPLLK